MTASGPRRHRVLSATLAALALLALGLSPAGWRPAEAEDFVDLTLLFTGSVQGKIAPCG